MLRLASNTPSMQRMCSSHWLRIRAAPIMRRHIVSTRRATSQQLRVPVAFLRTSNHSRSLSDKTTTDKVGNHQTNLRLVEEFTEAMLDPTKTPLGTLSSAQIGTTFQTIEYWAASGSDYGLNAADHLLQRLVHEHATLSPATRSQGPLLVEYQRKILEEWLRVGKFSVALERAEHLLMRLNDWTNIDLAPSKLDVNEYFVRLCDAWLNVPGMSNSEGSTSAGRLLLWWTEGIVAASSVDGKLVPLFHQALQKIIQSGDSALAHAVIIRMNELAGIAEWSGVQPDKSAWKAVNNLSSLRPPFTEQLGFPAVTSDDGMAAEGKVIRHLLYSLLKTAKADDLNQVEEAVQKYEPWAVSDAAKAELSGAMTDYYARTRNVTKATQWVQKVDPATFRDKTLLSENLKFILQLWANSNSAEAPWRGQEILQRLEALEAASGSNYSIVARMWLQSSEPSAKRKAKRLLSKIVEVYSPGKSTKIPDTETLQVILMCPEVFRNTYSVRDMGSMFLEHWQSIPRGLLPKQVEGMLAAVAEKGICDLAEAVMMGPGQKVRLTTTMCENVIKALANSHRPDRASAMFNYFLERRRAPLSFSCYDAAIRVLVDAPRDNFDNVLRAIRDALDRMARGDLTIPPEDFTRMMFYVSNAFMRNKRPQQADELLLLVEKMLLGSELVPLGNETFFSIKSYNNAIAACLEAGNFDKAHEIVDRVLGFYDSGISTLRPNRFTFSKYLKYISRTKSEVNRAADFLDKIIGLYKEINDVKCKPDIHDLNVVLYGLARLNISPNRSLKLLENMLEIGVKPIHATFNWLIKAHLKTSQPYRDAMRLVKRMNDFGLEPNKFTALYILSACQLAPPRDRDAALANATQFLGRIRQQGTADELLYVFYFDTVNRLLLRNDPRYEALLESTFQLCCADGFDKLARQQLGHAMSPELKHRLNSHLIKTHKSFSEARVSLQPSADSGSADEGAFRHGSTPVPTTDVLPIEDFIRILSTNETASFNTTELTKERLTELVEKSLDALADRKQGRQAEQILRQAVHHVPLTSTMCLNALLAQFRSTSPYASVNLFDYLEMSNAPLSFDCYRIAIRVMVKSRREEQSAKIMRRMGEVINRMLGGDFKVPSNQFVATLVDVTLNYEKYQRPQEAEDVLVMVEEMLLRQPDAPRVDDSFFSIRPYNNLIKTWIKAGNSDKAKATYDRVLEMYRSGISTLMPHGYTFSLLLSHFSSETFSNADTAASLLEQKIQFYQETKHQDCQVTVEDFNRVLAVVADQSSERAMEYMDRLLDLGIEPRDYSFHAVMRAFLKKGKGAYRPVLEQVKRMRKHGLEPNQHTAVFILESCLNAHIEDQEAAMATAWEVLSQHHREKTATVAMYVLFFRLLEHRSMFPHRNDSHGSKQFESAFQMCWNDGFHIMAGDKLQSRISKDMWDRLTRSTTLNPPVNASGSGNRNPDETSSERNDSPPNALLLADPPPNALLLIDAPPNALIITSGEGTSSTNNTNDPNHELMVTS